jgi:antitoxin VapB
MEDSPDDVTMTARERLEQEQQVGKLADELLRIGKDCAAHLKEPFKSADHGDLLYGEKDLPTDR